MGSLVVLGILLVMVIIGPHIKGYDYVSMNIAEKNQGVSSKYWFGTDNLGRDLFSRVWVGARASLDHRDRCNGNQTHHRNGIWRADGTFRRLGR